MNTFLMNIHNILLDCILIDGQIGQFIIRFEVTSRQFEQEEAQFECDQRV